MDQYIKCIIAFLLVFVTIQSHETVAQSRTIILTWDDVTTRSINDNIGVKLSSKNYRSQELNESKVFRDFLPTLTSQGSAVKNLELPEFVFQGQRIKVGTNYNFQHSLQLSLPIFTGGSRWANFKAQSSLKKSLKEELHAATDDTILQGLQSYLGIILANSMIAVSQDAVDAAKANLANVQQFFEEGMASDLDLQRARAQYTSTLPQLEAARNRKKTADNQLKYILNIPIGDSVVIVVSDSLKKMDITRNYDELSPAELSDIAYQNRSDIKSIGYQADAARQQKNAVLSSYFPTLSLSADLSHQAQVNNTRIAGDDFVQSKTVNMYLNLPLFDSGKRHLEYQQALIEIEKMELTKQQVREQIKLEIEQNYYSFQEALNSLHSLEETLMQARESLRLANLMYQEGMSTQVEVLDAQLFYTQSNMNYLQGIYNYNVSQLSLLRSIGKIDTIVTSQRQGL